MSDVKYFFNLVNGNIDIKKCNNSVHSSKSHFHNEISLAFVESGSSIVYIGDKTLEITGETLLIIPPDAVHKCNPESFDLWKFRMLYINKEWFESVFQGFSDSINFSYIKTDVSLREDLLNFFKGIEKGLFDIEMELKLLKYISLLTEIFKGDQESSTKESDTGKLQKAKEFIEKNYLANISLGDLSKESNISKYHLIREFERNYGLSPHQYMTNCRINHAKDLLKNSLSLTEVAYQSGFYDQSHFIRCFKEYTGVTPKEFKRNT